MTPTPARADATCPPGTFPPPGPIAIINPGDDISCVNVYDRSNTGYVIDLQTNAANEFINLNNSGILTAITAGGNARGISTHTGGATSPIAIENSGGITVHAFAAGIGIYADTDGAASSIKTAATSS